MQTLTIRFFSPIVFNLQDCPQWINNSYLFVSPGVTPALSFDNSSPCLLHDNWCLITLTPYINSFSCLTTRIWIVFWTVIIYTWPCFSVKVIQHKIQHYSLGIGLDTFGFHIQEYSSSHWGNLFPSPIQKLLPRQVLLLLGSFQMGVNFEHFSNWFRLQHCLEKERLPTPVFWPGEFHGL